MRPQQQNRRMRGRNGGGGNNPNRKGPNPLTRNYESNGPDVKIRGSAQQIAEKYAQLARDAQSSGDRVMAENYLQHAEHYNRIIAAAQAQMPIQNVQNQQRDGQDDDLDDERDEFDNPIVPGHGNVAQAGQGSGQGGYQGNPGQGSAHQGGDYSRQQNVGAEAGSGPQPVIEGVPAEVALNSEAAGEGNAGRDRQANGASGFGEGRRSRRPRRGERSRPETGEDDAQPSGEGLAATLSRGAASTAPQRSAEGEAQPSGDGALIEADS